LSRGRGHRAVEDRLQRLVARLAFLEAQVVAEHDEALGPAGHQVDDVGQVDQVGLVDLDQTQALGAYSFRQALISEDLPVPRAPVSSTLLAGQALHELRVLRWIASFWTSISFRSARRMAPRWRTGSSAAVARCACGSARRWTQSQSGAAEAAANGLDARHQLGALHQQVQIFRS
jgi:hypothetical protein